MAGLVATLDHCLGSFRPSSYHPATVAIDTIPKQLDAGLGIQHIHCYSSPLIAPLILLDHSRILQM